MSEQSPPVPDYSKFIGQRWYRKEWVRKWAAPVGLFLFAVLLLMTRSGPAQQQQQQREGVATAGDNANQAVTDLRDKLKKYYEDLLRRTTSSDKPPAPKDTPPSNPAPNAPNYRDQVVADRQQRRQEAFAAPIFSSSSAAVRTAVSPQPVTATPQQPSAAPAAPPPTAPAPIQQGRILPGTPVEAALDTALTSTMTGTVLAHLTRDVRDPHLFGPVILPAGTRLIGEAQQVTNLNQPRLKVQFSMAVLPDGTTENLANLVAMDQQGRTGLADHVNNHWLRTMGIAGAVGLIEGLSLSNAGVSILSPRTEVYTGVASEAGREGMRILERFLNAPPEVEVHPGSRLRIIFI